MERKTLEESKKWLEACVAPYLGGSLPGFFRARVVEPEKTALIHRDRSYTYAQLHDAIDATAQALIADLGVSPGDRVVMNLDNSDYTMILYFAIQRAGAVSVPINPKLTKREVAHVLGDCTPSAYVCDPSNLPIIESLTGDYPVKVAEIGEVIRTEVGDVPLPEVTSDMDATIFYTSGTTGAPKGVVHTHKTFIYNAFQSSAGWQYAFPCSQLDMIPMFHVASHGWFYPLLAFNGTLVVDTYSTERCFELIDKHKIEGLNAVPATLLMMVNSDLRDRYDTTSVTNVRFGASPMPPEKLRAVQELFPNAQLLHGMGQTESGGTISVLPPELAYEKNGSTGFPIPGFEVRIVDDRGQEVPTGAHGEVLARGAAVMSRYFNRPEATEETLAGGWLHTGDLGYLDEDGCIYLVDRKKDMIIRGGENVYSVEIENVLITHPSIDSCAVIGVPDTVLGEKICGIVVTRGTVPDDLIGELKDLCRRELAGFKVPELWEVIDELPRTATGKIQKAPLRASLLDRQKETQ